MKKIGFIGVGNMGFAIMKAVAKNADAENIYISDPNSERVKELSETYHVQVCDNEEISKKCDFIFLGVKPQVMKSVLSPLGSILKAREQSAVLVSMAAGLEISAIREICTFESPVIRIMPNLPVSVGKGMTLYDVSENVTEEKKNTFCTIMAKTGKLLHLPEKLIDAGCSVSGCGPAFVCLIIEAMADAGVKCGLPRDTANTLAIQTLLGTSELLNETNTHPAVLKDAVCSPGGSTIAGVEALENDGLRSAIIHAVEASFKRNRELGGKK